MNDPIPSTNPEDCLTCGHPEDAHDSGECWEGLAARNQCKCTEYAMTDSTR